MSCSEANIGTKPTAVTYFKHAVRSFVAPYGEAKPAPSPSDIYSRLKPFTCEWLTRPGVAMSEFAETIERNMALICEDKSRIASPDVAQSLHDHFGHLKQELNCLNNKTGGQATKKEAKKVLLSVALEDEDFDKFMNEMFRISNAMFAISSNYVIARSLIRHPTVYSSLIEVNNSTSRAFKENGTAQDMVNFLLNDFKPALQEFGSKKESKLIQKVLTTSTEESASSSDESIKDIENSKKKTISVKKEASERPKKRKRKLAKEEVSDSKLPASNTRASAAKKTKKELKIQVSLKHSKRSDRKKAKKTRKQKRNIEEA